PTGDFHHLGGRGAADRGNARKRDGQRHPGGDQDCRALPVRGGRAAEFQALQHRAAHLYAEIEIARAAAFKAAQLLDSGDERAELYVSVAKAKAADVASLAVRESVQMHGGIGMTDEHDIGLFMKREAVLGELFGDVFYHRERVATLSGY